MTDYIGINDFYVMAVDNGCEGHSPPVQLFAGLTHAKAAMAIATADGCSGSWKLYRVPMWPEKATRYFDIKALEL